MPVSSAHTQFDRLRDADLHGLIALQDANLHDALEPAQRNDGFLSARFDEAQFAHMNRDIAVIVARETERIVGYLCASGIAANRDIPLLATMIAGFSRTDFLGRSLSSQRSFIYGPVCVANSHRGAGVLRGMYDRLRDQLAGDYDAGVLFIAKSNGRSLGAHHKLGCTIVGEFRHDDKAYWTLAFPIPQPGHC